MNTVESERWGGRKGEQEGAGQPRDIPPQHVADEAAALQEYPSGGRTLRPAARAGTGTAPYAVREERRAERGLDREPVRGRRSDRERLKQRLALGP